MLRPWFCHTGNNCNGFSGRGQDGGRAAAGRSLGVGAGPAAGRGGAARSYGWYHWHCSRLPGWPAAAVVQVPGVRRACASSRTRTRAAWSGPAADGDTCVRVRLLSPCAAGGALHHQLRFGPARRPEQLLPGDTDRPDRTPGQRGSGRGAETAEGPASCSWTARQLASERGGGGAASPGEPPLGLRRQSQSALSRPKVGPRCALRRARSASWRAGGAGRRAASTACARARPSHRAASWVRERSTLRLEACHGQAGMLAVQMCRCDQPQGRQRVRSYRVCAASAAACHQ